VSNFWGGFEKRANENKRDRKKTLMYAGLGAAAALGAGLAGRKIYSKYFKTFKDAQPKFDMWYTQNKFHNDPSKSSHIYDALGKTPHEAFKNGPHGGLTPESRELLDINWEAKAKGIRDNTPFRYKGKWVTSEYGHLPHDPLLSDEINRRSPYVRAVIWDKKPHLDAIMKSREPGYKEHTDIIKATGQAMKEFKQKPTGAGT
jgi:hypothetical protein